jgi:hypothetical protein
LNVGRWFVLVTFVLAGFLGPGDNALAATVGVVPKDQKAELEAFSLDLPTELVLTFSAADAIDISLYSLPDWLQTRTGSEANPPAHSWLAVMEIDEVVWISKGDWVLIADNTQAPPEGAYSAGDVAVSHELSLPDRSLWSALTFHAPYVALGDSGIASLTLWMLLGVVLSLGAWTQDWKLMLGGTSAVAMISLLSAVPVPGVGLLINYVLPVLAGTATGVAAYLRAGQDQIFGSGALIHAYHATFVGVYVVDIAYIGMGVFHSDFPIIGGAGFSDVLFVAPLLAMVLVSITASVFRSHLQRVAALASGSKPIIEPTTPAASTTSFSGPEDKS